MDQFTLVQIFEEYFTPQQQIYTKIFLLWRRQIVNHVWFFILQIRTFCGFFRWQIYATRRVKLQYRSKELSYGYTTTPNVKLHFTSDC